MAVKRSQSVQRALAVMELIASRQPIGVSALAKLMDEDRSAVQRAVFTLADAGWIRPVVGQTARWEMSAQVFTIAHALPHSTSSLRQQAREILDELRDRTGETASLTIPDGNRFVVVEVSESRHMLRMVPRIGEVIRPSESASGRAVLPHFDRERQVAMLGRAPNQAELREFSATIERGYSISAGETLVGATNIGAAVMDRQGRPIGAVLISGPSDRLTPQRHDEVGRMLAEGVKAFN